MKRLIVQSARLALAFAALQWTTADTAACYQCGYGQCEREGIIGICWNAGACFYGMRCIVGEGDCGVWEYDQGCS